MILEQLVHAKRGRADGAFVGQVGGLECHAVIARNVIEKLPLKDLKRLKVNKSNRDDFKISKLTFPHTGQRPESFPLLAASCIELVTRPCDPRR